MLRFPDPSPSRRREADAGFTLIEVLVAFLVIAIIAAAGTSLTIRGMRATFEAKQLSQATNLVNEQVELMRGLPFFVSYLTHPEPKEPLDLLDTYFPGKTAAAKPVCTANSATWIGNAEAWSGYVGAGNSDRCSFEPAPGTAFYRKVIDAGVGEGATPTAFVVSSQFIGLAAGDGSAAPWVDPPTGYAWDAADGKDAPVTTQMAAYVTAVFGSAGNVKRTTTRTDIADRLAGPALISGETHATAVIVERVTDTGEIDRLELGSVSGSGSVTVFTTSAVDAVSASMQSGGQQVRGRTELAQSPGGLTSTLAGGPGLAGMTIGATGTVGVTATGTAADPGFGGSNGAVASASGGVFNLDGVPVVTVSSNTPSTLPGSGTKCPTAGGAYGAAGSGWMDTGATTLAACAQSAVSTVSVLDTVEIKVLNLVARCDVNGSTPSAMVSGTLVVSIGGVETVITLNGDAPPSVPLPAPPPGIENWEAFPIHKAQTSISDGRSATAQVPAALTLVTTSGVKVTVGRALCSVTDRR